MLRANYRLRLQIRHMFQTFDVSRTSKCNIELVWYWGWGGIWNLEGSRRRGLEILRFPRSPRDPENARENHIKRAARNSYRYIITHANKGKMGPLVLRKGDTVSLTLTDNSTDAKPAEWKTGKFKYTGGGAVRGGP